MAETKLAFLAILCSHLIGSFVNATANRKNAIVSNAFCAHRTRISCDAHVMFNAIPTVTEWPRRLSDKHFNIDN